MSYQVGDTYPATVSIRDEHQVLVDPADLTLAVRGPTGTVATYVYATDAVIVRDGVGVFHADVALTAYGMWAIAWATTDEDSIEGVQIAVSPAPTAGVTFATVDELALRLAGTTADQLPITQLAQGRMLLELVTGMIVETVGRDDAWAQALHPIPRIVRAVCLEAVARVLTNPTGARSESETLGAYQHASSYTDQAHGLALTDDEVRACRRAVWGRLSATSMPATTLDLAIELADSGDVTEFPAT